jgi:2-polyprenyl-6-methoxyphenol hydroxylase-like FAD-dependent oxidoreductase
LVHDRGSSREIFADLVVAADGRNSDMRGSAKLPVIDLKAPIDVLWMRISRLQNDPEATGGRYAAGRILVMINRNDYWQCAYVFPKGSADQIHSAGLPKFRQNILDLAPFLSERVLELDDWEKIKLLTVQVNRLRNWAKPGLLCVGDAAHAMSPIGGVGINLAVQDAVAAANLLFAALKSGAPSMAQLNSIQERREWPTKMTQSVQIFMQNNILARALTIQATSTELPLALKIMRSVAFLRRVPARVFGLGFRPEHVHPALRGTPPN